MKDEQTPERMRAGEENAKRGALPRVKRPLVVVFFGTIEQRVEAVAITILILAGLAYWTYGGIKHSLQEVRSASLRAVLESKVAALNVWVDTKRADAEQWAAQPEVAAAARTLHAAARDGVTPEALRTSPAHAQFLKAVAPFFNDPTRVAFNVVDRNGTILASRIEAYTGLRLAPRMLADLAKVFAGTSRFVSPRPESEHLPTAPTVAFARPIVWFAAPLFGADGKVIAAVEFGTYADTRFAAIVGVAQFAAATATGDAYAFDDTGLLLTEPRYGGVLRAAGVLPRNALGAAFNIRLRAPPHDVAAAPLAAADLAGQPLVASVEHALASRSASDPRAQHGVLIEPYRNYAGREVIGAWQWLPDHGIGIAVEIGADEAYAPMRYLTIAFEVVFGMLVLAVTVAFASTFSIATLWREDRQLGQYRLERQIGDGATASVYVATHRLLKRPTAVKILKPHMATDELIARFEREVQLASRLHHPATVEIYDYGRTRDGTLFYAMEYVAGVTLAQLVERDGPQPPARAAHILKQVCESLREAHTQGLVHRDIKPQNIMLCEHGGEADVVKVLDFGLVKDIRAVDARDITQYARMLGTPLYMAPERIRNPAEADPLVDIYAVGAVAFLLLTGKRVFDARTEMELQDQVLERPAPRASSAAQQPIPRALDDLIARCLEKAPAARPQRIDELIEVFAAILRDDPWAQNAAKRWWREFAAVRETAGT